MVQVSGDKSPADTLTRRQELGILVKETLLDLPPHAVEHLRVYAGISQSDLEDILKRGKSTKVTMTKLFTLRDHYLKFRAEVTAETFIGTNKQWLLNYVTDGTTPNSAVRSAQLAFSKDIAAAYPAPASRVIKRNGTVSLRVVRHKTGLLQFFVPATPDVAEFAKVFLGAAALNDKGEVLVMILPPAPAVMEVIDRLAVLATMSEDQVSAAGRLWSGTVGALAPTYISDYERVNGLTDLHRLLHLQLKTMSVFSSLPAYPFMDSDKERRLKMSQGPQEESSGTTTP